MQTNNKLRDALMQIYERVNSLDENCGVDPVEIRDIAKAALAEPVRNCDVGTAEEQEKRYDEWLNADVLRGLLGLSPLEWAQAPYEEGGAK